MIRIISLGLAMTTASACASSDFKSADKGKKDAGTQTTVTTKEDPSTTKPRDLKTGFVSDDHKTMYVPIGSSLPLGIADPTPCTTSDAKVVTCSTPATPGGPTVVGISAGSVPVTVTVPGGAPITINVYVYNPANPPPGLQALANASTGVVGTNTAVEGGVKVENSATTTLLGANIGRQVVTSWVQSAPANVHSLTGISCPAGFTQVVSVGDCSSDGVHDAYCYGVLNGCQMAAALTSNPEQQVVVDIKLGAENAHNVTGGSCLAGYSQVGGFADCGNGICNGVQLICALVKRVGDLTPGSRVLTGTGNTTPNLHIVGGPAIPAGTEAFGSSADCGMAAGVAAGIRNCQGNQIFYASYLTL